MLKIAHISDLHLSKISFHPSVFFSKRWIGNCNLLFSRKKTFGSWQLDLLPDLFSKLQVDYVIVSGDITCTSSDEEFHLGKKLFLEIEKRGIKILTVPGNHDVYTKKSDKEKSFYRYFSNVHENLPSSIPPFTLEKDRVEAHKLKSGFWLVGIDTAISTSLIMSTGLFSQKTEENLFSLLSALPPKDPVIVVNHFPFLEKSSYRKRLERKKNLQKIIESFPNIRLFLHGHTHTHQIIKHQKSLVLDCGSSSHTLKGTLNLLSLAKTGCDLTVYHWQKSSSEKKGNWQKGAEEGFSW
jgi:3',5'-cyclic AMP phosphodiesterase CpdA